jgi:hypothetical protein
MSCVRWLRHVMLYRETPARTRSRLYAELRQPKPAGESPSVGARHLRVLADRLEAAGDPERAGWIREAVQRRGY